MIETEMINQLLIELSAARKQSISHRQEHEGGWTPETLEQQFQQVKKICELRERIKQSVPDLDLEFISEKRCYGLLPRFPVPRQEQEQQG